ncbi:MAG: MafI family immunity protein [Cellulomonas sp.]|nr:MafI family immunity protein [Cellulomonas sp.]
MDPDLLTSDLRWALDRAVGLPASDVDSIAIVISAGEWQFALETLCTQTYEYDVVVSEEQRSLLGCLGRVLDVPVGYLLGDPWAPAPGESDDSHHRRGSRGRRSRRALGCLPPEKHDSDCPDRPRQVAGLGLCVAGPGPGRPFRPAGDTRVDRPDG